MNVSALNGPVIIAREVKVKNDLAHVASFMTGAAQLGSWLSPVKSVDASHGGRVEFRAEPGFEHGGEYTTFDAPNHFVLNTDKFGEIDARIVESGATTVVNFVFTKSDDEDYEKIIADTVTRFIAMVNYK